MKLENSNLTTNSHLNLWKRFTLWLDHRSETHTAYLYLLPSLMILLFTVALPMVYAIILSLMSVAIEQGGMKYTFVGVDNFIRLFQDTRFPQIMGNTILYTVVKVAFTLLIGFCISLIIYYAVWGASVFKRLFLLPWALSHVVNALMWQWMYSGDHGIINEFFIRLGILDQYKAWLSNIDTAMGAVIFADIWKSTPLVALLLLASMQMIPKDLSEAAKMDGAGPIITLFHIIIPQVKPVIMVLLVIETMWALRTFDLIWVLTGGGPQDSTMILNVFAYEQAFQTFSFGYGSAITLFITVLTLVFTLIYMRILKTDD